MATSTTKQLASFVRLFLLNRYDSPVETPDFHREMWEIVTNGSRRVAFAAPRAHAKSTAITHALTLFLFLFRIRQYGFIVSDTEAQAAQFLGDIKTELLENTELRETFGVKRILKDAITDIIIECNDGYQFRLQALGAEQKVRGRKWRNKRPDYIVCDDLENDEMVESETRREKFRNWFFKALVPSLSKTGQVVVVGTILHLDSVLMRLLNNKTWTTKLYTAHQGFDDFSNILWPAQYTREDFIEKRQEFIDDGYPEGYSQEYLNNPLAHSEAFFRAEDFLPLEDGMRDLPVSAYAAVDFAISDADRSAFTVIVIGCMDSYHRLQIRKVIRMRGDGNDILDTIFEVQRVWNIDMWKMEQGQIERSLRGEIYRRMTDSGTFLNISMGVPTKDKRSRARAIQARMRAGGVYFDTQAEWYGSFYEELMQFPKGQYKDQVDALAWLGIAINDLHEGPTTEELRNSQYAEELEQYNETSEFVGRDAVTGY